MSRCRKRSYGRRIRRLTSTWRRPKPRRPWHTRYSSRVGSKGSLMGEGTTQESYIVNEGKKRGSTRDVRPEAAHDRYYTVLRVHPGDALLNDNWHTNEGFSHTKANFEGYTFAMRTLEASGATSEN